MLMRKEMILTVFIVSVAFEQNLKFQTRVIQFRPAAHRTSMMRARSYKSYGGLTAF